MEQRSQSSETFWYPIAALFLREWAAVVAIFHKLFLFWWKNRPDEIFEVLDYDYTLVLHDPHGYHAELHREQKVKYLQNHVIAFQDYAWGEGNVVADYQISPGRVVDIYREAERWNILISLRRTRSKGDIDTFHIVRTVKNSLLQDKEWFQTVVMQPTHRIRLAVIFPSERPPKQAVLKMRRARKTVELNGHHRQTLPDGREMVAWEQKNPQQAERFTIEWDW